MLHHEGHRHESARVELQQVVGRIRDHGDTPTSVEGAFGVGTDVENPGADEFVNPEGLGVLEGFGLEESSHESLGSGSVVHPFEMHHPAPLDRPGAFHDQPFTGEETTSGLDPFGPIGDEIHVEIASHSVGTSDPTDLEPAGILDTHAGEPADG